MLSCFLNRNREVAIDIIFYYHFVVITIISTNNFLNCEIVSYFFFFTSLILYPPTLSILLPAHTHICTHTRTTQVSAQCTLINFIVTKRGLEDQLLSTIVSVEEPQLEATRTKLVLSFNTYKIQLKQLEDQLLEVGSIAYHVILTSSLIFHSHLSLDKLSDSLLS